MALVIDFNSGFVPRPEGTIGTPSGHMIDFGFPASVNVVIFLPPILPNDLSQLDKGIIFDSLNVDLGPTLGEVREFILSHRFITSSITMGPFFQVALVQGGQPVNIMLPDVVSWLQEAFYRPFTNYSRTLWVKDFNNTASVNNITILPFAGQTIDGLAQYVIISDHALIRLYPRTDKLGWYVG